MPTNGVASGKVCPAACAAGFFLILKEFNVPSQFSPKDLWLSLDLGPRVYGYTIELFKRVIKGLTDLFKTMESKTLSFKLKQARRPTAGEFFTLIYSLKYLQKKTGLHKYTNLHNNITIDNRPHPRCCLPLLYLNFNMFLC